MTFYDRLEIVIKKIGISHRQFSLKVGKSQSWLPMLLQKKSGLMVADLAEMKNVFGVNPLYIMEGQKPEFLK